MISIFLRVISAEHMIFSKHLDFFLTRERTAKHELDAFLSSCL